MEMFLLIAAGALAGFLNGWLGLGGMSVIVPALMHAGLTVPDAFANAFTVTAINSAVAWLTFHRRGYVDYRSAAALVLPAAPASILAFASMLWAGGANTAALMLGIFLLAMGCGMWRLRHIQSAAATPPGGMWGVFGGLLSGAFGFNGNAFFIPVLRRHGLAPHRSVATVHAIGTCIASSAVIVYVVWGWGGLVAVNPGMVGYLTVGGLVAGRLGGLLKMKTSPLQLSIFLCAAYLASGALLVAKHLAHPSSGLEIPGAASVAPLPSAGPWIGVRWRSDLPEISISPSCCCELECTPPPRRSRKEIRSKPACLRRRNGQSYCLFRGVRLLALAVGPSLGLIAARATECRFQSAPRRGLCRVAREAP